ncbi:MAG: hypothetical protein Q8S58_17005 [Bosea sp. (in: a-proteobacteria)]|uniref:hypothetical protein n=1 Tax=Bosea sp. (in: a-proteobacteria) TaxID=1871050 RepID=UPI0027341467|nr:hypothetical protein [Bosea sp. (in: a-proteobacteria)]MDP3254431.1 hypothetical protein [Bosea sp. (in: a-proteobacteria)]MDP3320826.1 hypothetical protein [Bosea sp. (in: a-proteobacteria)]
MMTLASREPIIIADAGPILRLAAAGLLSMLPRLNRHIVLVDRVEDELVGDGSKPFATEIRQWIASEGEALLRVPTIVGEGIAALKGRARTPEEEARLKSGLRNSGELALREFVDLWRPDSPASAIVLYEDRKVPNLFLEVDYPVTLMTTRAFVRTVASWGINLDAPAALEAVAAIYDLKPAMIGEIDPQTPVDLRRLPTSLDENP